MSFHQILAEIVEKTQVDPNFIVYHADFPPLELRSDILDRLQRIPAQLQSKYLTMQVQNYLYHLYFTYSTRNLHESEIATQQSARIKNNLNDGVDIDFYQRLQQSNCSRGYLDPDWQVVAWTEAGEAIVVKDGLHLHINPQRHLPPDGERAEVGASVSIYLPPNLVDRDTYIIVGNAGTPVASAIDPDHPVVQIYFNFTPDAAVAIAQTLSHQLNELGMPFQLAILHDPALFYRYDGATLWLSQVNYLATQNLLRDIYLASQTAFATSVPLFTKQLAPGLGLAEVPTTASSFGMQRCELIAIGLVTALDRRLTSATDKLQIVGEYYAKAGIDLHQPYLNPQTIDRYPIYSIWQIHYLLG